MGKKKQEPLPSDPIGAKFCQLFTHGWHFIVANIGQLGERARQWYSENGYRLQPRNLWGMYRDPNQIIGLRFGSETKYAVIDIDQGSPYHPHRSEKKFKRILHALEEIGLCRYIIVQSSYSEGIHIFIILPEPVATFGLACAIRDVLEDAGFYVRDGQLEIFPNVKAYRKNGISDYKGIRLPLQPGTGSYILDDDLCPSSDSIEEFLNLSDWVAQGQDLETLKAAMVVAWSRQKNRRNFSNDSQKTALWEAHLLERIGEGWTDYHQTNDLLKDFGVHGRVFKGLGGEKLAHYIYQTALSAPGYRRWCRHQHEIMQRCREWARSVEDFNYPIGSYPNRKESYAQMWERTAEEPSNPINEQRKIEALERVKQATDHVIKVLGALPKLIKERIGAIVSAAKELTGFAISRNTLYKQEYLPFWHPKYDLCENVVSDEIRNEVQEPSENVIQTNIQLEVTNHQDFDSVLNPPTCSTKTEPGQKKPETSEDGDESFCPTPPPIYEGSLQPSRFQPAPQGLAGELVNELKGGFGGESGSQEASDAHKDISEAQETPAESKQQEVTQVNNSTPEISARLSEADQSDNGKAPGASSPDELAAQKRPSLRQQHRGLHVALLRVELLNKARKLAKAEAMRKRIYSAAEREANEIRIKMRLFVESGEPELVAEAEAWAANLDDWLAPDAPVPPEPVPPNSSSSTSQNRDEMSSDEEQD